MKALPSLSQTGRAEEGFLPASTAASAVLHLCSVAAESCPASSQATSSRTCPADGKGLGTTCCKRSLTANPEEWTAGSTVGSSRRGKVRGASGPLRELAVPKRWGLPCLPHTCSCAREHTSVLEQQRGTSKLLEIPESQSMRAVLPTKARRWECVLLSQPRDSPTGTTKPGHQ